jgi:hypothetical protein
MHGSDSPVSYKNDESTRSIFKWKGNGVRPLQKNKEKTGTRKHFKCTPFWKTTNCKAKYNVTLDTNEKQVGLAEFENQHNHLPPPDSDLPLRKDVKDSIHEMSAAGASTLQMHKYFVNKPQDSLSATEVPTCKQVKNMKAYAKSKYRLSRMLFFYLYFNLLFTGFFIEEVLANISAKHGLNASGFVLGGESFPKPSLVMASEFALDLLTKSDYVIVDGTFSTTEHKMVLTTILGFYKGVSIPCAYFLSESRDTNSYKYFFEVLLSFVFSLKF